MRRVDDAALPVLAGKVPPTDLASDKVLKQRKLAHTMLCHLQNAKTKSEDIIEEVVRQHIKIIRNASQDIRI